MSKKTAGKTSKDGLTYAQAGVDIDAGDALVDRLAARNKAIGGFGGNFPLNVKGMKKPTLVAATDGVGTKLLIARELGVLDSIGVDLVAMVVNDLIVNGAKPLFFLDYYATGKLSVEEGNAIIEGIEEGCAQAAIPLIGGETAEMPGLYAPGDFDLAGFGVGLADAANLVDGRTIKPGDVILGLSSSGFHSNGYSLLRAILKKRKIGLLDCLSDGEVKVPVGALLLEPTRIYVRSIAKLLAKVGVKGMAHITGGGLEGNVPRCLPKKARAVIDTTAWMNDAKVLAYVMQDFGGVDEAEMYRVFNMGIGYVVVVAPEDVKKAIKVLEACGEEVFEIGRIERGERGCVLEGLEEPSEKPTRRSAKK